MEQFVVNGLSVSLYFVDSLFIHKLLIFQAQPLDSISSLIKSMGFNCVRLPFSTELFESNPLIESTTYISKNPQFLGAKAMDVFNATITSLTNQKLMIILDNHQGAAAWCCADDDGEGLWYTVDYPESTWLSMWSTLALQYKSNPYIIGADLRNELRPANGVHPTWGTGIASTDWAAAATRAGNAILSVNSNWLIFVEGINYSLDFTGAYTKPIVLNVPNRVVYAPHDYSWSQSASSYNSFKSILGSNWGFLITQGQIYTAPVWIGEFGTDTDAAWWSWITQYISEGDLSWSYWSINGDKYVDIEDSYGLLMPDYETVRDVWKLADLKSLQ